jgi:hypothetical protein
MIESQEESFGREGVCWGCGENSHRLSQCHKTPKKEKEKFLQGRGFSNRKLAVLTDQYHVGKDLALFDEGLVPVYLTLRSIHNSGPKLLVKNLEEAASRVVEVPLEEPVKMRTAVKHVLTVAKSMVHLTVQITTRAGPVRIRRLRANGCPRWHGGHSHWRRSHGMPWN